MSCLGVSRAHVRKLLHAARETGLLIQTDKADPLALSGTLLTALRRFYAAVFVFLADAALDAVRTHANTRM